MAIPININLYTKATEEANKIYKKHSAYKSGFIQKRYKELGGKYYGERDIKNEPLTRWYREEWVDIGNDNYPVYRPTIRINKSTPLTVDEIDKNNIDKQIKLKQKIKGNNNLPPFKPKKYNITDYSYKQAKKLNVIIKPSTKKNKKIDVFDKSGNYILSIGDIRYKDYPTYIIENGLEYANNRKKLYMIRHKNNINVKGTPGYYAFHILW
jgi:hypothetical protein